LDGRPDPAIGDLPDLTKKAMAASLTAALDQHRPRRWPELLGNYAARWLDDRDEFKTIARDLPEFTTVDAALGYLDLKRYTETASPIVMTNPRRLTKIRREVGCIPGQGHDVNLFAVHRPSLFPARGPGSGRRGNVDIIVAPWQHHSFANDAELHRTGELWRWSEALQDAAGRRMWYLDFNGPEMPLAGESFEQQEWLVRSTLSGFPKTRRFDIITYSTSTLPVLSAILGDPGLAGRVDHISVIAPVVSYDEATDLYHTASMYQNAPYGDERDYDNAIRLREALLSYRRACDMTTLERYHRDAGTLASLPAIRVHIPTLDVVADGHTAYSLCQDLSRLTTTQIVPVVGSHGRCSSDWRRTPTTAPILDRLGVAGQPERIKRSTLEFFATPREELRKSGLDIESWHPLLTSQVKARDSFPPIARQFLEDD
jgi:hypothetical protein